MTGNKLRPRTEPMYSGGNRQDFPITSRYATVSYTDFISSHVFNSQNILISQSMNNGFFSGIFASSELYNPRPAARWGIRRNYDEFLVFAKGVWKSKKIYSLACDEKFGFGAFFMKGYGTKQFIVKSTDNIKKHWNDGLKITSCAALDSRFYIVMTKDIKEYRGKGQKWFTCSTWKSTNVEIQGGYQEGKAITGICYSSGLKLYFVVMTASMGAQCFSWFDTTEQKAIFKDPTDNNILIVMTKDENISAYVRRSDFELR